MQQYVQYKDHSVSSSSVQFHYLRILLFVILVSLFFKAGLQKNMSLVQRELQGKETTLVLVFLTIIEKADLS